MHSSLCIDISNLLGISYSFPQDCPLFCPILCPYLLDAQDRLHIAPDLLPQTDLPCVEARLSGRLLCVLSVSSRSLQVEFGRSEKHEKE